MGANPSKHNSVAVNLKREPVVLVYSPLPNISDPIHLSGMNPGMADVLGKIDYLSVNFCANSGRE